MMNIEGLACGAINPILATAIYQTVPEQKHPRPRLQKRPGSAVGNAVAGPAGDQVVGHEEDSCPGQSSQGDVQPGGSRVASNNDAVAPVMRPRLRSPNAASCGRERCASSSSLDSQHS